jgi:hypothetical protein
MRVSYTVKALLIFDIIFVVEKKRRSMKRFVEGGQGSPLIEGNSGRPGRSCGHHAVYAAGLVSLVGIYDVLRLNEAQDLVQKGIPGLGPLSLRWVDQGEPYTDTQE